ncbi:MAG: LytR/AlgR family response regulator transcription factor [Steroidobacteraceae bacterium]
MPIRTLLVDDEEIARRGLRVRLERAREIEIIGECQNGFEAIETINLLSPDLVFLDVQMPELSGFDVLRSVRPKVTPHVVFVTAFDQYAVRAFEVHALDYLLKPIDDERFAAMLRHSCEVVLGTRDGAYAHRFAEAIASLTRSGALPPDGFGSDRLAIPAGDRVMIIRLADIDWIQASDNYVSIHVGKKSWLLRETISALDQRLTPKGFARIHRSTIVNAQRVTELRSLPNGEFAIGLADGTTLRMSKSYRAVLDQLVGTAR